MNNFYNNTIPRLITEKMKKFLMETITRNQDLFKYELSRLKIHSIIESNWFGNVTATGIITFKGIKDIKIKSLDSLTATIPVFYDDNIIASYIVIYFDDNHIVIPDFIFTTTSMNLSICENCNNHKNDCTCKKLNESMNDKIKEIMSIININNPSNTTIIDPDELLIQPERRYEEKEEKPKFNMDKYEPVIIGISTTLKYNKKKVEEAAIKILTSNPDMPDNQLATEIIRNLKG